MNPRADPTVKICCIQSEAEVRLAYEAGARFVGLVGPMPSGPGPLPDEAIVRIAAAAHPALTTVLLTSQVDARGIIAHVLATGVSAVQIVRAVPTAVRRAVREALPHIEIIQVAHMEGAGSVRDALAGTEEADYLLLDSGRPGAAVAELGGTGRTHDWALSARVVEEARVPVLLAGGLDPGNVEDAVTTVRPYGVDVCSGLRTEVGLLDGDLLADFMDRVRGR